MQIHPQVHFVRQSFIYQYLIILSNSLVLVDSGLRGNHIAILNYLKKNQLSGLKLERILVTHSDADHVGGINQLRKLTDARVMASTIEADAMAVGRPSRILMPRGFEKIIYWFTGLFFRFSPTITDSILKPGDVLPVLGGLDVLDTSGHTPGHISFFSGSTGILFCGDSIDLLTKNPRPSTGANTWNPHKAKASYEYQMSLKPSLICAGHGYLRI